MNTINAAVRHFLISLLSCMMSVIAQCAKVQLFFTRRHGDNGANTEKKFSVNLCLLCASLLKNEFYHFANFRMKIFENYTHPFKGLKPLNGCFLQKNARLNW
ncbi:hypothetical protein L0Z72_15115 [candidate division KSB1 bacterium]|nr:hypothetical protein [candidate division KSB1 bacterium]